MNKWVKSVIIYTAIGVSLVCSTVGVLMYRDYGIKKEATGAYNRYIENEENKMSTFNDSRDVYIANVAKIEQSINDNKDIVLDYISLWEDAVSNNKDVEKVLSTKHEDLILNGDYDKLKKDKEAIDELVIKDRNTVSDFKEIKSMSESMQNLYKLFINMYDMANQKPSGQVELFISDFNILSKNVDDALASWNLIIPSYKEIDIKIYDIPEDVVGWYKVHNPNSY